MKQPPPIELEILADQENMAQLCERYWELEAEGKFRYGVSALAAEFNIPRHQLSTVIEENCKALSTEDKCDICGAPYVYKNRTDFHQRFGKSHGSWICETCAKKRREQEAAERRKEDEWKRERISEWYDLSKREPLDISPLSFEEAVFWLSFVRHQATEDYSVVYPFAEPLEAPFAPTKKMHYDVLRLLHQRHLIFVHPSSPPEAFKFEDDKPSAFYLDYVKWALPAGLNGESPQVLVQELESILREMAWPDAWHEQAVPLWKKVAIEEAIAYLHVCLEEHGFSFNPGEKTYQVFNNLIEHFSVAQAYTFIWRAAKDAAAYYVRGDIPKQRAANAMITFIQNSLERAILEEWEIKLYRRNYKCPQSTLSKVLFYSVLQIGDDGFNTRPG